MRAEIPGVPSDFLDPAAERGGGDEAAPPVGFTLAARSTTKRLPPSGSASHATRPPWRSAIWRTSERPRPQPPERFAAAGGPVERLEHPLALGGRDPLATIGHGDPRCVLDPGDGDADRRPSVLDGVLQQVADQAAQQRGVAFDFDRLAALCEARDARLEARRLLRGKSR